MSTLTNGSGLGPHPLILDHRGLPHLNSTELFSLPAELVAQIQLAAARRIFTEQRDRIPALRMLADAQGISSLKSLSDLAPLLFSHAIYKSYDASIVEKRQFGRLSRWYSQLTHHDICRMDFERCASLDDWLIMLSEQSPTQPRTSSGTTGKTSFLPSDAAEQKWLVQAYFIYLFQGFGTEPRPHLSIEDLRDIPYLHLTARYGPGTHELQVNELVRQVYRGREDMVYALNPGRLSSDAKLNYGGPTGANVAVISQEYTDRFFSRLVDELAGSPILTMGHMPRLYEGALLARQRGIRQLFSGGFALIGGGMKGQNLPPDYFETIINFLGDPVTNEGYGCSEQLFNAVRCPQGNFHPFPMTIIFQLDVDDGGLLPRSGDQTGRYGFFNLFATAAWGGFVTGDAVTISWDQPCPCGRNGPYIHPQVERLAARPQGDANIALNGDPRAHHAMAAFLETIE